jgi:hypothetical protein
MKHLLLEMTGVLLAQEVTHEGCVDAPFTWMVKILLAPSPPRDALWLLTIEWSPKWKELDRE